MLVELVYEKTCPNIEAARTQLLNAFSRAGLTPHWREWEVSSPSAPAHVHGYGSPTILVDGRDVSGENGEGDDYCCRIYRHDDPAHRGVPPLDDIVQALLSGAHREDDAGKPVSHWGLNGSTLPALGIAFLPKLACPACWPAYAGLLGSLGIGFFDYTPYLLPMTLIFLFIALAALAYRAQHRHGYKPLLLGLPAAGLLLIGKFAYASDVAMYMGLFLLVVASLWNTWRNPGRGSAPCPACVTAPGDDAGRL